MLNETDRGAWNCIVDDEKSKKDVLVNIWMCYCLNKQE